MTKELIRALLAPNWTSMNNVDLVSINNGEGTLIIPRRD